MRTKINLSKMKDNRANVTLIAGKEHKLTKINIHTRIYWLKTSSQSRLLITKI
jgi:hypothetical protein